MQCAAQMRSRCACLMHLIRSLLPRKVRSIYNSSLAFSVAALPLALASWYALLTDLEALEEALAADFDREDEYEEAEAEAEEADE